MNTASRLSTARSSSPSRSWLQSMVCRSVWCRGTVMRLEPVSRRNRSSSLAEICSTGRARTRAAASSIASGTPSSRRQIWAIAEAFRSVIRNSGTAAIARSTKRRMASYCGSSSGPTASGSGTESDGTGRTVSPEMASPSRLVATTRRRLQLRRRASTDGSSTSA